MNFLKFLKLIERCEFSEFFKFFKFFEYFDFFECFEFEFHEFFKFMIIKSKIFMTSIIINTTNFNQSINQSNDLSINQTFDQLIDQSIEITSTKFIYSSKNFIKQNSMKKRKSNDINKILLFTFNLNK